MSKAIVKRVDKNLARRLRFARQETGLSTRAIVAKLPTRLAISHTTLASYENGTTMPPIDVLAALADLYRRTLNWFLESRESLDSLRYRNLKTDVGIIERRQFEAAASKWLEGYVNLGRHLKKPLQRKLGGIDITPETPPIALAMALRKHLGLDEDLPVPNVVKVLEETCAVYAIEIRSPFRVDTLAAKHGNDSVVVLNPEAKGDRLRMTIGQELAWAVYGAIVDDRPVSQAQLELKAYEFASAFLLPQSQLLEAFDGKSFFKLIEFRERFGISLSAMIHRAEQMRVIKSTTARSLWSKIAEKGWKVDEPGYVARDRAIRFETMLETAIESKAMSWSEAEKVTGIQEAELRSRLDDIVSRGNSGLKGGNTDPVIVKFNSIGD